MATPASNFPGDPATLDLSVFVACYNEEDAIAGTIQDISAACIESKLSYEIIVIDDCSSDQSVSRIREFQAQNPQIPITFRLNEKNRGLAYNYVEGAFMAKGEWYRLVCGDHAEPKDTLMAIFKHLGEAEIIIPYHTFCAGRTQSRRLISRLYTFLVNSASGFHIQYYNGILVTRTYYVKRWHSNLHGFGFLADLTTCLLSMGMSYVEVPVQARDRLAGESKAMTFRNFCSVGLTLLTIFSRRFSKIAFGK